MAYRKMKMMVEKVVERGDVYSVDHIIADKEVLKTFSKCNGTNGFTNRNHPAIIQVLPHTTHTRSLTPTHKATTHTPIKSIHK